MPTQLLLPQSGEHTGLVAPRAAQPGVRGLLFDIYILFQIVRQTKLPLQPILNLLLFCQQSDSIQQVLAPSMYRAPFLSPWGRVCGPLEPGKHTQGSKYSFQECYGFVFSFWKQSQRRKSVYLDYWITTLYPSPAIWFQCSGHVYCTHAKKDNCNRVRLARRG